MALTGEPYKAHGNSSCFDEISNTTAVATMSDSPGEWTPAQIEAKKILVHVLDNLKDPDSKYYAKYGRWARKHPGLSEFCFDCVRPQVWTFLDGRSSLDAIKNIGGDLKLQGRGIYLNGILGLDKKLRIYIGQATNLRTRISQHLNFRHRRDSPSLHYHALQLSIYNSIGYLAILPSLYMGNHTLPGMDDPALLLNLLEMWMCLLFRTLPPQTLCDWMPVGVDAKQRGGREGEVSGLNVANPLDQSGAGSWQAVDLSESDDPLVRDYLSVEAQKMARLGVRGEIRSLAEVDPHAATRKAYTEKAQRRNEAPQSQVSISTGTIVAVGIAAILGFALGRGLARK